MALGLGGIGSMGIGLAVFMDDQFTKTSNNIRRELGLLGKDTDDFSDGLARLESFGTGLKRAGDAIVGFGVNAFKEYAKLDDVVNSTRSIIGGFSRDSADYKELYAQTQQYAMAWGIASKEIAGAQLELAKAGKTRKEVMEMTEEVVILGAASETALNGANGVAVMLSDIMNIYGETGLKATRKFSNLLTSAANRSTIDVKDFYQSLKYSADIAKQLQVPVEETASVIAAMGNAGLKGSMGGVAYANMLRYLSKAISPFAAKKQTAALKLLDIDPSELKTAAGNMKPIGQIFDLFRERSKGMSSINLQNTLGEIFGVRGNRGFEPLLKGMSATNKNLGDYEAMYQQINKDLAENISLRTAQEKTNDAQFQLDKLSQTWQTFKERVGAALGPALAPFISGAQMLLTKLNGLMDTGFGQWLVRATFIFGGVGLAFLGRFLIVGARFMAYIMTSAGKMQNASMAMQVAGSSIRANLVAGGNALVASALRARNITAFTNSAGVPMLVGRTARGTFAAGARSNFLSKGLGAIFGFKGLRWAASLTNMFKPIAAGVGWLGKVFSWFKIGAGVLGKVFGWLFGWEAIIVDLVLTMTTGKGLFEWLWVAIKKTAQFFGLMSDDEKTVKANKKFKYEGEIDEDNHSVQKKGIIGQKETSQYIFKRDRPQTINITVNPVTGDKKTQKSINLQDEQTLNSFSINH